MGFMAGTVLTPAEEPWLQPVETALRQPVPVLLDCELTQPCPGIPRELRDTSGGVQGVALEPSDEPHGDAEIRLTV